MELDLTGFSFTIGEMNSDNSFDFMMPATLRFVECEIYKSPWARVQAT